MGISLVKPNLTAQSNQPAMSDEQNNEEERSVLDQVAEIAMLTGIKGRITEDGRRFRAVFGLPDDRSQLVLVREIRTPGGPGICVYSVAARYPLGFLKSGISKKKAIDMLLQNDDLCFARYGLAKTDDEMLVVVSIDMMLSTLDPPELEMAMISVAHTADQWEEAEGLGDDL